tara:strand:- start:473 stop:574 length:102 start_codon:yes stop_codon:yes gene_type:complete
VAVVELGTEERVEALVVIENLEAHLLDVTLYLH